MQMLMVLVLAWGVGCASLPRHQLILYGNASLGYYFTKILVGTPPQEQSVIVDTGSGLMALPCSKCVQCSANHMHPLYDVARSSTSKYVTCVPCRLLSCSCAFSNPSDPCTFLMAYAEGSSLSGILIEDYIRLQNIEGEQIKSSFGCTTKQTNLFLTQYANGIMGFAPKRNSTFLQDLINKHHPQTGENLVFSVCLSSNGGVINVGSYDKTLHSNTQPIKTTFETSNNLYALENVGQVRFGRNIIHKNGSSFGRFGVFIDTGSTYTYFQSQQYLALVKAVDDVCTHSFKKCEIIRNSNTRCYKLSFESTNRILNQETNLKTLQQNATNKNSFQGDKNTPLIINDQVKISQIPFSGGVNSDQLEVKKQSWMESFKEKDNPQILPSYTSNNLQKNKDNVIKDNQKTNNKENSFMGQKKESFSQANNLELDKISNTIDDLVMKIFPAIQIDINGKTIYWVPTKYLLLRSLINLEVCLGIQKLDRTLLGANFIVDTDVQFDLINRTVQLFFNSTCSNQTSSIQIASFDYGVERTREYIANILVQNKFLILVMIFLLVSCVFIVVLICLPAPQETELLRVPTQEDGEGFRGRKKRKLYGGITSLGIQDLTPLPSQQRLEPSS